MFLIFVCLIGHTRQNDKLAPDSVIQKELISFIEQSNEGYPSYQVEAPKVNFLEYQLSTNSLSDFVKSLREEVLPIWLIQSSQKKDGVLVVDSKETQEKAKRKLKISAEGAVIFEQFLSFLSESSKRLEDLDDRLKNKDSVNTINKLLNEEKKILMREFEKVQEQLDKEKKEYHVKTLIAQREVLIGIMSILKRVGDVVWIKKVHLGLQNGSLKSDILRKIERKEWIEKIDQDIQSGKQAMEIVYEIERGLGIAKESPKLNITEDKKKVLKNRGLDIDKQKREILSFVGGDQDLAEKLQQLVWTWGTVLGKSEEAEWIKFKVRQEISTVEKILFREVLEKSEREYLEYQIKKEELSNSFMRQSGIGGVLTQKDRKNLTEKLNEDLLSTPAFKKVFPEELIVLLKKVMKEGKDLNQETVSLISYRSIQEREEEDVYQWIEKMGLKGKLKKMLLEYLPYMEEIEKISEKTSEKKTIQVISKMDRWIEFLNTIEEQLAKEREGSSRYQLLMKVLRKYGRKSLKNEMSRIKGIIDIKIRNNPSSRTLKGLEEQLASWEGELEYKGVKKGVFSDLISLQTEEGENSYQLEKVKKTLELLNSINDKSYIKQQAIGVAIEFLTEKPSIKSECWPSLISYDDIVNFVNFITYEGSSKRSSEKIRAVIQQSSGVAKKFLEETLGYIERAKRDQEGGVIQEIHKSRSESEEENFSPSILLEIEKYVNLVDKINLQNKKEGDRMKKQIEEVLTFINKIKSGDLYLESKQYWRSCINDWEVLRENLETLFFLKNNNVVRELLEVFGEVNQEKSFGVIKLDLAVKERNNEVTLSKSFHKEGIIVARKATMAWQSSLMKEIEEKRKKDQVKQTKLKEISEFISFLNVDQDVKELLEDKLMNSLSLLTPSKGKGQVYCHRLMMFFEEEKSLFIPIFSEKEILKLSDMCLFFLKNEDQRKQYSEKVKNLPGSLKIFFKALLRYTKKRVDKIEKEVESRKQRDLKQGIEKRQADLEKQRIYLQKEMNLDENEVEIIEELFKKEEKCINCCKLQESIQELEKERAEELETIQDFGSEEDFKKEWEIQIEWEKTLVHLLRLIDANRVIKKQKKICEEKILKEMTGESDEQGKEEVKILRMQLAILEKKEEEVKNTYQELFKTLTDLQNQSVDQESLETMCFLHIKLKLTLGEHKSIDELWQEVQMGFDAVIQGSQQGREILKERQKATKMLVNSILRERSIEERLKKQLEEKMNGMYKKDQDKKYNFYRNRIQDQVNQLMERESHKNKDEQHRSFWVNWQKMRNELMIMWKELNHKKSKKSDDLIKKEVKNLLFITRQQKLMNKVGEDQDDWKLKVEKVRQMKASLEQYEENKKLMREFQEDQENKKRSHLDIKKEFGLEMELELNLEGINIGLIENLIEKLKENIEDSLQPSNGDLLTQTNIEIGDLQKEKESLQEKIQENLSQLRLSDKENGENLFEEEGLWDEVDKKIEKIDQEIESIENQIKEIDKRKQESLKKIEGKLKESQQEQEFLRGLIEKNSQEGLNLKEINKKVESLNEKVEIYEEKEKVLREEIKVLDETLRQKRVIFEKEMASRVTYLRFKTLEDLDQKEREIIDKAEAEYNDKRVERDVKKKKLLDLFKERETYLKNKEELSKLLEKKDLEESYEREVQKEKEFQTQKEQLFLEEEEKEKREEIQKKQLEKEGVEKLKGLKDELDQLAKKLAELKKEKGRETDKEFIEEDDKESINVIKEEIEKVWQEIKANGPTIERISQLLGAFQDLKNALDWINEDATGLWSESIFFYIYMTIDMIKQMISKRKDQKDEEEVLPTTYQEEIAQKQHQLEQSQEEVKELISHLEELMKEAESIDKDIQEGRVEGVPSAKNEVHKKYLELFKSDMEGIEGSIDELNQQIEKLKQDLEEKIEEKLDNQKYLNIIGNHYKVEGYEVEGAEGKEEDIIRTLSQEEREQSQEIDEIEKSIKGFEDEIEAMSQFSERDLESQAERFSERLRYYEKKRRSYQILVKGSEEKLKEVWENTIENYTISINLKENYYADTYKNWKIHLKTRAENVKDVIFYKGDTEAVIANKKQLEKEINEIKIKLNYLNRRKDDLTNKKNKIDNPLIDIKEQIEEQIKEQKDQLKKQRREFESERSSLSTLALSTKESLQYMEEYYQRYIEAGKEFKEEELRCHLKMTVKGRQAVQQREANLLEVFKFDDEEIQIKSLEDLKKEFPQLIQLLVGIQDVSSESETSWTIMQVRASMTAQTSEGFFVSWLSIEEQEKVEKLLSAFEKSSQLLKVMISWEKTMPSPFYNCMVSICKKMGLKFQNDSLINYLKEESLPQNLHSCANYAGSAIEQMKKLNEGGSQYKSWKNLERATEAMSTIQSEIEDAFKSISEDNIMEVVSKISASIKSWETHKKNIEKEIWKNEKNPNKTELNKEEERVLNHFMLQVLEVEKTWGSRCHTQLMMAEWGAYKTKLLREIKLLNQLSTNSDYSKNSLKKLKGQKISSQEGLDSSNEQIEDVIKILEKYNTPENEIDEKDRPRLLLYRRSLIQNKEDPLQKYFAPCLERRQEVLLKTHLAEFVLDKNREKEWEKLLNKCSDMMKIYLSDLKNEIEEDYGNFTFIYEKEIEKEEETKQEKWIEELEQVLKDENISSVSKVLSEMKVLGSQNSGFYEKRKELIKQIKSHKRWVNQQSKEIALEKLKRPQVEGLGMEALRQLGEKIKRIEKGLHENQEGEVNFYDKALQSFWLESMKNQKELIHRWFDMKKNSMAISSVPRIASYINQKKVKTSA